MVFSAIFEGEYWDELNIQMARSTNWYIKHYLKCIVINVNGRVPLSLIKWDKVHYKNLYYHIFMDKCDGTLLEFYYKHNNI